MIADPKPARARRTGRPRRLRWPALLVGAALVAASCGGDDDSSDGTTATDDTSTDITSGATEPATDETAVTTSDSTGDTTGATTGDSTGGSTGDTTPEGDGERDRNPLNTTPTDEGEPVRGGTLIYGVEADTANAWPGYRASFAPAGYVVISTVSDPLFLPNDDGETIPHLVESAEANEDFTEWTFTLREGITFHDGTPFDAAAVKVNMDACRAAPLSSAGYSTISDVQAEGQVVTITTSGPWASLPAYFATNHGCSYMLSGEWLKTLPDLPQRDPESPVYDEEIAAGPADGDPSQPIGLGAFELESYTPGNGNAFIAVRNEDYWRGDGPNSVTGEGLPYLDRIEIVVAVDIEGRSNGCARGSSRSCTPRTPTRSRSSSTTTASSPTSPTSSPRPAT